MLILKKVKEVYQCTAELSSINDDIYKTVILEKFGALETFGEVLSNSFPNHPGTGKANERSGFCNVDIAQHCKRGTYSASRGVG